MVETKAEKRARKRREKEVGLHSLTSIRKVAEMRQGAVSRFFLPSVENAPLQELLAYKIEQGIATWNPADNPNATVDPYRTLFVARIVRFSTLPSD